jgi:hypothetical protein
MKKGEFWRLFSYFMLHSDLQHLCVNLFHLLDTLDLEGVPDMEVSPGASLRCSRDGPVHGDRVPVWPDSFTLALGDRRGRAEA